MYIELVWFKRVLMVFKREFKCNEINLVYFKEVL